ncbi:unnamed protein product [Citrullus colocynthis]|uniref:Transmembrane protein n=1 Tax=Citrullus colocynthis TaxID=252529 RepID=A0ABP0XWY7_9ROSI
MIYQLVRSCILSVSRTSAARQHHMPARTTQRVLFAIYPNSNTVRASPQVSFPSFGCKNPKIIFPLFNSFLSFFLFVALHSFFLLYFLPRSNIPGFLLLQKCFRLELWKRLSDHFRKSFCKEQQKELGWKNIFCRGLGVTAPKARTRDKPMSTALFFTL